MDNNQIKAIIFDLGNVLIDFDHMIAARKISKFTDKGMQEIFSLFFDSEITQSFEEGRLSPADFFSRITEKINLKLTYEEFLPIWNEIFFLTPKNLQVYNLARALRRRYSIALLSNINILHFEYLKKNFSVFDAFHNIFLSYELHLRKPDSLIYEMISQLLGFKPQEIFYTDDRLELVGAAKKIGMISFHFINPGQLKNDLLSAGIDIN